MTHTSTIPELLKNKFYRNNQTLLTNDLGVNRGTLRRYMHDISGEYHIVKVSLTSASADNILELFTNQTNKKASQ